ncbi:MAG TPA: hypothetical protein VGZ03_10620 [Acidimicrobiales bacterium]|nr:hypothetical protein [Acidimicrobiales bacterium]
MNVTSLLGAVPLIATVVEILVFVVVVGVLAMIFIVAVGNRTDQDPTGSRPISAYLFSAGFLFLWIAYFGIIVAANSLIDLIGSHPSPFGTVLPFPVPSYSYRDAAIRACVLGGILVVVAGGACVLHLQRGSALADAEANPSGPTKRVMRSYVALVCFISIIIVVLALSSAIWMLCGLISPRIFLASSSRIVTERGLLQALVLVVLAGAIFTSHQRFAPKALRLMGELGPLRRAPQDGAAPPGSGGPTGATTG